MRVQTLTPLELAVLKTVAYADVFDYPMTPAEVHRYLIGLRATPADVDAALNSARLAPYLVYREGYAVLRGREACVAVRQERETNAHRLWPRAVRYGHAIGHMPFVRMVAVTGALAVNNVKAGADIDYLVVTEPGHLWVCRATIITLVRLARRQGVELCPNYFLSTRALVLSDRNLFTAHEVAHMVPLVGHAVYRRLRALNRWTDAYLPNAKGPPPITTTLAPDGRPPAAWTRALEALLRSPVGRRLEQWEQSRKVRAFRAQAGPNSETSFGPDCCKGHFDGYGQRTIRAFHERLTRLKMEGDGEP